MIIKLESIGNYIVINNGDVIHPIQDFKPEPIGTKVKFLSVSTGKEVVSGLFLYTDILNADSLPIADLAGLLTYLSSFTVQNEVTLNPLGLDAFNRLRVSQVTTLVDLKQLGDSLPLFYDTETIGAGAAVYNVNDSTSTLSVTNNLDLVIKQTFQRFNYQSGKSHQIFLTFANLEPEAGTEKEVGYYNSDIATPFNTGYDGIYLSSDGSDIRINQAKNGVITSYTQNNFNLDKLDGSGKCPVIDFSKGEILMIDFEWLSLGAVACALVVDRKIYYFHVFNNANNVSTSYMRSPNHSVRYSVRSTGGAGSLEQICATVGTEGATNITGKQFSENTAYDFQANTLGSNYMIYGMRLKGTHVDHIIDILKIDIMAETNDDFIWEVRLNPSITNVVTWGNITNSAIQIANGIEGAAASANIVSGGTLIESGNGKGDTQISEEIINALKLGSSIAGIADIITISITPISAGLDLFVSKTRREVS